MLIRYFLTVYFLQVQSKIYTNSEPAGGINISYTLSKHSISQMLDTGNLTSPI